jgi:hypothetical protein
MQLRLIHTHGITGFSAQGSPSGIEIGYFISQQLD